MRTGPAGEQIGGVSMGLSSGCESGIGLADDRSGVGAAVAEHGEQDAGAAAGQADQGGVVAFALGSFAVVVEVPPPARSAG